MVNTKMLKLCDNITKSCGQTYNHRQQDQLNIVLVDLDQDLVIPETHKSKVEEGRYYRDRMIKGLLLKHKHTQTVMYTSCRYEQG